MVVKSKILNDFPRFFGVLVVELATGGAVNLALKVKRDMIIENLDLEPKINAMMRNFLESPSRWKELSKETSSKILPSRDGSCRKTLKLIASLIAKDEHPFCTNRMVSDHRGTTLFPSGSSMVFR
ncbi:hypothetical protein Tco_1155037 [Tanacetum coccineum]